MSALVVHLPVLDAALVAVVEGEATARVEAIHAAMEGRP